MSFPVNGLARTRPLKVLHPSGKYILTEELTSKQMEDPEEICQSDTVYGKASMGNVDMRNAHDKNTSSRKGKSTHFFQKTNQGQDGKIFNLIYII